MGARDASAVIVFILVCFIVTIVFMPMLTTKREVYATGVLALMTSAAIAVTISAWRKNRHQDGDFNNCANFCLHFGVNIIQRPKV
jgi:protein-S-isoprenylcysteine O-methyltransferase Ste14